MLDISENKLEVPAHDMAYMAKIIHNESKPPFYTKTLGNYDTLGQPLIFIMTYCFISPLPNFLAVSNNIAHFVNDCLNNVKKTPNCCFKLTTF